MAETGSELLYVSNGKVVNVPVGLGDTLVPPRLSFSQAEHYFANIKSLPALTELVDIKNDVPVKTSITNLDPTRAMQYGNDSAVVEHKDVVWENCSKIFDKIVC